MASAGARKRYQGARDAGAIRHTSHFTRHTHPFDLFTLLPLYQELLQQATRSSHARSTAPLCFPLSHSILPTFSFLQNPKTYQVGHVQRSLSLSTTQSTHSTSPACRSKMSDDELEYLTPGFDASSLTVPRIRSILVSHDVPYPASAKKSQLIQTFNEQITPRAPRMLASRNRTKRTSKGITDMPSSQESTVDGDDQDDADAMPPPPTPSTARRRTNKGTRPSAESSADIRPAAPKAKSPHKRTSKHPRASDSEAGAEAEDVRPTARKTQRSEGPPAVKVEESELTGLNPRARPEESPFSDDNPFQSGSSPMPATEPRRRTTGMKTDKKRVSSGRRKTERPTSIKHEDDVVVPSSRTFEVPINRVKAMSKSEPEDPLEAGEEFTPEEQQALAQDHTAQGRADAHVARRRKPKSTSSALKSAPWVILTTLLAGYAAWWRKEKIEVGFCGVGKPAGILTEIQIPDWASSLQPQCEPCPLHGSCYSDMTVRCDLDFILKSHPLSLGGLVPLPPTCEPDGEKARKVKAVTDRAVEELRDRRAKWECGELTDKTGKTATSPEIDEVKLKAEVGRKRRKAMNDFEFEELWRSALGEIQAREEVTSNVDGYVQSFLTPFTIPYLCFLQAPKATLFSNV